MNFLSFLVAYWNWRLAAKHQPGRHSQLTHGRAGPLASAREESWVDYQVRNVTANVSKGIPQALMENEDRVFETARELDLRRGDVVRLVKVEAPFSESTFRVSGADMPQKLKRPAMDKAVATTVREWKYNGKRFVPVEAQ